MQMEHQLRPMPMFCVQQALDYADLRRADLFWGPHPDTGQRCAVLDATIRQYSLFLVVLSAQFRRHTENVGAHRELDALCDTVQMENREDGDVRFWMPGLTVTG